MNKFIKVIKYYPDIPNNSVLTKIVFLQISSIESFERIDFDSYGSHFSYSYSTKNGEWGVNKSTY